MLKTWAWALLLLSLALPLTAAEQALDLSRQADATLDTEAAFLAAFLKQGGAVYYRLPAEALPSHDAQGRWRGEPLKAAMSSDEPLMLRGETEKAAQGMTGLSFSAPKAKDEGRWLMATGLPKLLLVENSSSVAPLSKGLSAWHWPFTVRSFSDIEADPARWLNASNSDLVVFSSPGWWEDFANPPGGPSRMPTKVVEALRDYVRQGGAALFVDIAQWDLEKAWPKSVSLAPLGPYAVSKLGFEGGPRGGLSLAPVGVGADKLTRAGAFQLVGSENFGYPDGGSRPLNAAYAMPDPGGGQGWVAGLSYHVFEQDDSLASAARRLLLNWMLLAGDRRLATQGEPKAAPAAPATPTRTPQRSATPTPTVAPPSPTPPPATAPPSATSSPLPTATSIPPTPAPPTVTPVPPTPVPPTRMPTLIPTPVPPTPVPPQTRAAVVIPATPVPPTLLPSTPVPPTPIPPTPVPTARPTPRPSTPVPTRIPPTAIPTPWPTPVPTRIRPTLVPTRAWSTPVPTWVWPTALPTLARPTAIATWARPTAVPVYRRPTLRPTPAAPALPTARPWPTSVRRPTARPRPRATATPWVEPTPRPTAILVESVRNALGCLDSAPEPFADGGVYLKFCLKHVAVVQVQVFDLKGKTLWSSGKERLAAGNQQWFFEGWIRGAALPPGEYLFQVRADYGHGQVESRQGRMTRGRSPRR